MNEKREQKKKVSRETNKYRCCQCRKWHNITKWCHNGWEFHCSKKCLEKSIKNEEEEDE